MPPLKRCTWVKQDDPLSEHYHDTEWGVPVHDDRKLFEFLILESAQAGLSWDTILRKREAYRAAFVQFDPKRVARFSQHDVDRLMSDTGIVRHRLKISAAIENAKLFLDLQKEHGSFAHYLWSFVDHGAIDGKRRTAADIPVTSKAATRLSCDLRQRGFRFFGPVIAYAYLQAVGVVNDHLRSCFRYREIRQWPTPNGK